MKRHVLSIFSIIFVLIFSSQAYSQHLSSANWPLTDPDDGGTGLTAVTEGQIVADDELLNNTEINHYSGPNSSQRVRIEGNEWPANQTTEIEDVYIEFAVSAEMGSILTVDSLSLRIAGISINTMKANIYYSTDSSFSDRTLVEYETDDDSGNNYLQRDSLLYISTSPMEELGEGETFYLRVYPWVDNDPDIRTGKYLAIQDVTIAGETESIPLAATVSWPLETDENPVITGAVVSEAQSYSPAMQFYDFTELPDTDGNSHTVAGIQTVSQEWNAEADPSDSLYIQYVVEPKFGGTLFADNFSLYIGGWFSSNLRAAVYSSKDVSFASKDTLIADTALLGDEVQKMEATLDDTVETGEKLYIRIYPHNTEAEGWAKLIAVDSVTVSGSTIGVTADPPAIITYRVDQISTTFVRSGGNISSDGGLPVTARGVVWNTEGEPTTADNKTEDGTGSGSYESNLTGLDAGTEYYLRAYATNDAGTSYGREVSFTTLEELTVPTVTTESPSNILVESAETGGKVTDWGGDPLTGRGVVWNTTGSPTIEDNLTEDGEGLGEFVSTVYPLTENTTYYIRAYATNSVGTAYGSQRNFKTKSPEPEITKIVAQDGSGDYTSVQDAFDDVPDFYTGPYTIYVKNGTYYEKLFLDEDKVNVRLIGEDRDSTILTYDDYAGIAGGTSNSYSVSIDADDFVAKNITFQNTVVNDKSVSDQQGVALSTNGDRQAYYNVNILGYQDTFYARGSHGTGRIYIKNSYIEGSVDFIFGRNIVVFDSTEIHINRNGGTLTAAATDAESEFGFVFLDNVISADSIGFDGDPITSFHLGRPWQNAPRTVFINTHYPSSLDPEGWLSWNVTPALYGEYNCSGPGCGDMSNRADISEQLTSEQAEEYTIENIFSKESNPTFGIDWIPEPASNFVVSNESEVEDSRPDSYKLTQNYPNPFNPTTVIGYSLPNSGHVNISLYDLLGRKVATLVNEVKNAGTYEVQFDASRLASGIYLYRIETSNFSMAKKMTLLK
ncbi:MAG: pectinesterase family protein [Balneolaceae bacterium]